MRRLLKPLNRRLSIILIALPLIAAFAVSTFAARSLQPSPLWLTPEMTPETTSEVDYSAYDPVQFGIPTKLAGYDVLAVFSEDNTACMPSGHYQLMVQVMEPDMQAYLESDTGTSIMTALDDLVASREGNWTLEIVGLGSTPTREQIVAQKERWNTQMRTHGCVRFGGPIILATPSPTP